MRTFVGVSKVNFSQTAPLGPGVLITGQKLLLPTLMANFASDSRRSTPSTCLQTTSVACCDWTWAASEPSRTTARAVAPKAARARSTMPTRAAGRVSERQILTVERTLRSCLLGERG